jgi:hypothetical protein
MNLPAQSASHVVRFVFRRVLRPDKKERRNGGALLDQVPRLWKVIEQAAAKNRIEDSKPAQVGVLEICLRKFHVRNLQQCLDESRLAKIRLAAFQGDYPFHARVLRQDKAMGAFQGAQFQNGFWMRRIPEEPFHPLIADCTDAAAENALSDPELINPRSELREFFFELCRHQVDRALRRSMLNNPA